MSSTEVAARRRVTVVAVSSDLRDAEEGGGRRSDDGWRGDALR